MDPSDDAILDGAIEDMMASGALDRPTPGTLKTCTKCPLNLVAIKDIGNPTKFKHEVHITFNQQTGRCEVC